MAGRRPEPATKPLQAHKESPLAAFEGEVGKARVVQKDEKSSNAASIGFYCSTCKASFTSSDAYLDHCNSRIHLKNLGIVPKVERVSEVERIKTRLQTLSKQKLQRNKVLDAPASSLLEARLKTQPDSLADEKPSVKKSKGAEDGSEEEDPELMAAMGFKSFV